MNPQHQFATYGHPGAQQQYPQQHHPQQQMYATAARTNSSYGGQFATVGRTVSMSGVTGSGNALPALSMWTPPSPLEHQYYDVLFNIADEEKRNAIGGRLAVMFFSKSNADKQVLREIWNIADAQQRGELSRNEFYVAMRLISMAQRREPVSVQRFFELAAAPFPLPTLDGVPPPAPSQVPLQPPAATTHMTSSGVNYSAAGAGAPPVTSATSSSGPHLRGPFAVTDMEKVRYDAIFAQYDADCDGFLLGSEAVALFQLSGLDRTTLREIWSLADRNQDSKLDKHEFYVAMHLIVCASKRGLAVPTHLPQELLESAFGSTSNSNSSRTGSFSGHPAAQPSATISNISNNSSSNDDEGDPFAGLSAAPAATASAIEPVRLGSFSSTDPSSVGATAAPLEHHSSFHALPTPPASTHSSFYGAAQLPQPPPPIGQELHSTAARTGSFDRTSSFGSSSGRNIHNHVMHSGSFNVASPLSMPASHTPLQQPFLSDDNDKQAVQQLDAQNHAVAQSLQALETKQQALELLAAKLRELDQLRHDLVTLAMKRERVRAANSAASAPIATTSAHASSEQQLTKRAVETSLQELIASERRAIERLQHDVAGLERDVQSSDSEAQHAPAVAAASAAPAASSMRDDYSFGSKSTSDAFTAPQPPAPLSSSSTSSSIPASFDAFNAFGANSFTSSAMPATTTSSLPPTPSSAGAFEFAATPSPAHSMSSVSTSATTANSSNFESFGDFSAPTVAANPPTSAPPSSSFDAFADFSFS